MPEQTLAGWGYIFRTTTGKLVSEATVIADPLPFGLTVLERPDRADYTTERWDEITRRFVPFTDTVHVREIKTQINTLMEEAERLDAAQNLTRVNPEGKT